MLRLKNDYALTIAIRHVYHTFNKNIVTIDLIMKELKLDYNLDVIYAKLQVLKDLGDADYIVDVADTLKKINTIESTVKDDIRAVGKYLLDNIENDSGKAGEQLGNILPLIAEMIGTPILHYISKSTDAKTEKLQQLLDTTSYLDWANILRLPNESYKRLFFELRPELVSIYRENMQLDDFVYNCQEVIYNEMGTYLKHVVQERIQDNDSKIELLNKIAIVAETVANKTKNLCKKLYEEIIESEEYQ